MSLESPPDWFAHLKTKYTDTGKLRVALGPILPSQHEAFRRLFQGNEVPEGVTYSDISDYCRQQMIASIGPSPDTGAEPPGIFD